VFLVHLFNFIHIIILIYFLNTFSLPSSSNDGLVITSVYENDGGEYVCSAINDAGTDNKTIILTVQGTFN